MSETDRKRVLGIVGSPRRGGNTEILVDEVLRSAEEAGAETEKVYLDQLKIGPCRACDACAKTGRCILNDDMPSLLEKMEHSRVWVLGTPVYYWGPTAQFKAFMDRWYGTENEVSPRIVEFKGKRAILVVPLGGSAHDARHTAGMIGDALAYKKSSFLVLSSLPAPRSAALCATSPMYWPKPAGPGGKWCAPKIDISHPVM